MGKKAAFFDIDGTLARFNGKELIVPESTSFALKEFRDKGNLAFICSGRPIRFIKEQFEEQSFDGYIAGNGTHIAFKGQPIYHRLIEADTIRYLIKAFDELDISCCFSGVNEGYGYNMDRHRIEEFNAQFREQNYINEQWKAEDIKVNTLDIFYSKEDNIKACQEYFRDKLVFNTHGPHMSADVSFVEWGKSHAIECLVKYLNIKIEDTLAFGDGYNDVEMLKTVNLGIAMGNGVEALKQVSDYVTTDMLEDGIYNAMKEYSLI
ncbi:HAD family hydrolase [Clostridium manihotivorum]|uniref:Cof-type HAD-IIB family hydrolase n=1 Tax=Clostridium manihotivorum TaxID=2320868 RepID=A0A410DZ61_9CLOT|nr:HAD family hydrolase [Clostridium manihotivorum]QAA34370.1 Cof-type HAD-IIB family hydrolase [Clostridium manihotivorum]